MIIGTVKEVKPDENRVALIPSGVEMLVERGHQVFVETQAGAGSGFDDSLYENVGATILPDAASVWKRCEMVMKVKEPQPSEWPHIRAGQIVFTYFHFAADRALTDALIESKCIAIAYETIVGDNGSLPLLTPMSEVAGRMAIHEGAKFLERSHGGRGILLGGVPGVAPATVVILGAGVVGLNATKMAAGLGCLVYVLDVNLDRLRRFSDIMPHNVITLMSNGVNLRHTLAEADLVVSSVLIPGGRAPLLIRKETLSQMKKGAVIVDVAIDQGGSTETSRPTSHQDPIYVVDGIVHYCVTNMPGAMPLTSTKALTNATISFAIRIAEAGNPEALLLHRDIRSGVNLHSGFVTHKAVADAFSIPYTPVEEVVK